MPIIILLILAFLFGYNETDLHNLTKGNAKENIQDQLAQAQTKPKSDEQEKRESQSKIEAQKREAKARALPSGEFNHYSDGSGADLRVTYEQYQYACNKAELSIGAVKLVGVGYRLVNELYSNNPNSLSNIKVFWSDQGRCMATFVISGMLKGTQYSMKVVGYAETFVNKDGKILVNYISQPYLQ